MHATIDDNHLKDLMKIALMELLEEHPAMLRGLMAEALEDMTADRSRGEREDDDYEEDDLIRERTRRHTARPRRTRAHASSPGFPDPEAENTHHRAAGRTTSEFSTTEAEGANPAGHWDHNEESFAPEESHPGATTSDYGAAFDPFFRKQSPASGSVYGGTAANPPFHHHANTKPSQSSFSGAGYLSRGLTFLLDPDLRPYLVLPMATSILLFSIAVWLGMGRFGAFSGWTHGYLPFWLSWIDWLLWPFFTIAPVVIIFYFFTLVANILAAPFNSLLAEKVSRKLNGLPLGGGPGFGTAILRVPSSLKEEWRKSVWFVVRAFAVMILFFIPLINLAAPFVWTLFSAWSLALKYIDYPVASQDLEFDETRALAAENRWLVLEFGGAVLLMTIVPVLNFVAMPAAVAGASALWTERMAIRRNV
ncbi:CysZ protein [Gammaproteobacteria bacterium]